MTQREGVQLITSFLHFLWANLCVLTCVRKVFITAPMTKLELVNVATIGSVIQFRVFDQWPRGGVQPITSSLHFLWVNLGFFIFIRKVYISSLQTNLDLVNLSIIHWVIQFRVFDQSFRWRGTTNHFISPLPPGQSERSKNCWKAIEYHFQDKFTTCKSAQYSLSNLISSFLINDLGGQLQYSLHFSSSSGPIFEFLDALESSTLQLLGKIEIFPIQLLFID